jgi:hypothetical protein
MLTVLQPVAPKWAEISDAANRAYDYIVEAGNRPRYFNWPSGLLTKPGANTKLSKASPLPIWGLTLAPAGASGYQLCPWRSPECEAACLGITAGRSKFSNVQQARINKTRYLMEQPLYFFEELFFELQTRANRKGPFAMRWNVLSDIPIESICPRALNLPRVNYDYTKSHARAIRSLENDRYWLTLSYSGHNLDECIHYLDRGGNVAMVFRDVPESWDRYQVINGDESDARWTDPKGCIVGLKAKGNIKDSVFVMNRSRV